MAGRKIADLHGGALISHGHCHGPPPDTPNRPVAASVSTRQRSPRDSHHLISPVLKTRLRNMQAFIEESCWSIMSSPAARRTCASHVPSSWHRQPRRPSSRLHLGRGRLRLVARYPGTLSRFPSVPPWRSDRARWAARSLMSSSFSHLDSPAIDHDIPRAAEVRRL